MGLCECGNAQCGLHGVGRDGPATWRSPSELMRTVVRPWTGVGLAAGKAVANTRPSAAGGMVGIVGLR